MQNVTMPLQMQWAPNTLTQTINPWSFNFGNIYLGTSANPDVEQEALEKVGSYGRQIGHLAEALEVVINQLKLLDRDDVPQKAKDALQVLLGDVAEVRQIKRSLSRS